MNKGKKVRDLHPEAWRIASSLNFCLAKIVGKFTAYPEVDSVAFRRIHDAVWWGLSRLRGSARLGDFCQELRAVTSCHPSELLRSAGVDDTDTRIAAIAQVVREHAGLKDDIFKELVTGLLSWEKTDKGVILDVLMKIIRG